MDIYMGDTLVTNIYDGGPDYSAIQGPCNSGFHIPSTAERTAVLNVVGTSGDDYFTYLHIPKCGYRDRKTANIITTYGFSRYWTYDMSAKDKANCWGIESTSVAQMYADDKPANGYPIRAFKDAPVAPDSSWTETISGKVWYNSTLGLISIKNGSEWITMQDKNVGATVVYNNGDTVSDSNTGSFFQFGNYYGFPYSGTLSTYTTLQDTTGYGWQNPYSDSHFVKINSNNWFSNTNNNIWGGVTGVVQKQIQEVYEGDTKIRPANYYYYDFRNKSTAIVQADGWQATGTSTVYRGANGFDSNADGFFFGLPVSEPSATRVRITGHFWIYGTVGTWSGAGKIGVNSGPNFNSDNGCGVYFGMLTSSSHRMRWFGGGSSSVASSTLWATSGESYEIVLELNKTTNTRHCTIVNEANPSTYLIDISTTLVNVNWNYIVVTAGVNGSPTGTFKDIKIEYDY